MLQPSSSSTKLRPRHGLAVAATVVICAVIAYGAFAFIAGIIAFLVKLAVVVGLTYLVVRLVLRHARR